MASQTVAVVGLGICGISAVKNLVEAGLDVTGFDDRDEFGGLWKYTPEAKTSVLPNTVANVSTRRMCFTDWPPPEDSEGMPPATVLLKYILSYVDHFGLRKICRLRTSVEAVARTNDEKWELKIRDLLTGAERVEKFDKLVLCMGNNRHVLPPPRIEGLDRFTGKVYNSHTAKSLDDFKDKKVLMVGLGNTAVDIADGIVGKAEKVYISHRRGCYLLPLNINGKLLDPFQPFRTRVANASAQPATGPDIRTKRVKALQDAKYDIPEEWGLSNPPSLTQKVPLDGDAIYGLLKAGDVTLVPPITKVHEATVELGDGRVLDIDTLVFCNGYKGDYSILGPYDPSRDTAESWGRLRGSNGRPLPRLYRGLFSLDLPDSLAISETVPYTPSAALNADLGAMVVAQVFAGRSRLPSREAMERTVRESEERLLALAAEGETYPNPILGEDWAVWADDTAGWGVYERITGWGWKAWWFWLTDRSMYNMIMDGAYTPHIFRLFDEGKRKAWPGARAAIIRANEMKAKWGA